MSFNFLTPADARQVEIATLTVAFMGGLSGLAGRSNATNRFR